MLIPQTYNKTFEYYDPMLDTLDILKFIPVYLIDFRVNTRLLART